MDLRKHLNEQHPNSLYKIQTISYEQDRSSLKNWNYVKEKMLEDKTNQIWN